MTLLVWLTGCAAPLSSTLPRTPGAATSPPVTSTTTAPSADPRTSPSLPETSTPPPATPDLTADRAAILALAGVFDVTAEFTFAEGIAPPSPPSPIRSRLVGYLTENSADRIGLQYFLLFGEAPLVIKYYREEWVHQPSTLLTVVTNNTFTRLPLPLGPRPSVTTTGTWTRTVYQADEAPAYAAAGRWTHDARGSSWAADRPVRGQPPEGHLNPADASRTPPRLHDEIAMARSADAATPPAKLLHRHVWMASENSGSMTPTTAASSPLRTALVRYIRLDDPSPNVIDAAWQPTAAYWAKVRQQWSAELDRTPLLTILSRDESRVRWRTILTAVEQAAQDPAVDPASFAQTLPALLAPFLRDAR